MLKKTLIMLLVILSLTACTAPNTDSKDKLNEKLTNEVELLKNQIGELEKKNSKLSDENITLKQSLTGYDYSDTISFKDVLELDVIILNKIPGDDLYPYYIIATMKDVDHNTPLILTTDSKETYDDLAIGYSYDLDVHVETVVDKTNNNIRFVFTIFED